MLWLVSLWSSVLLTLQKCICCHFSLHRHTQIYTTHSSRPTLCHNSQEFSILLCLVFCCCFYFPKIFPFCGCKWLFLMLEVCSVDYVGYFPLHVPSLCFACFFVCFLFFVFFSLCGWFTLNRVCFIIYTRKSFFFGVQMNCWLVRGWGELSHRNVIGDSMINTSLDSAYAFCIQKNTIEQVCLFSTHICVHAHMHIQ